MIKRLACAALLSMLSLQALAQSPKPAAPAATAATLEARVKAEAANFKGKVFLFAKNLDSGATYNFNGDEKVRSASTIKTAIMVEAFARVAEGKAKWGDELILSNARKASGSGILQELSEGLKLSLRDAVNLMMILSDNTATNLVLEVLTADAVNARMDSLGLKNTRALRKIGGGGESAAGKVEENKRYGLGMTTPHEMVMLMEKLENGEAGALDALRSNVGIIYSKRGRIAMAITCDQMPEVDWTADNAGYYMLSRLSQLLLDGLAK
jgi:beta-lactamase class A